VNQFSDLIKITIFYQSLSKAHKTHNPGGLYFINITTTAWVIPIAIGITRLEYRRSIIDRLIYCQEILRSEEGQYFMQEKF
jgi:hypothetical protein